MNARERAKALITAMNYAIESGEPDLAFSMLEKAIIAAEEAKAAQVTKDIIEIIEDVDIHTRAEILETIRARSEGGKKEKGE